MAAALFAATFWSGMLAVCRPCQPESLDGGDSAAEGLPAPCYASMLGLFLGGTRWRSSGAAAGGLPTSQTPESSFPLAAPRAQCERKRRTSLLVNTRSSS